MPDSRNGKLELRGTIHDTAAAIRLGGDGWFVTFAGTEQDKAEAAKLVLFNRQRLKTTVELDDGSTSEDNSEGDGEGAGQSKGKPEGRPWLRKGAKAKPAAG